MEAGAHLHYWDTSGPATAPRAGVEMSNHWGAVRDDGQVGHIYLRTVLLDANHIAMQISTACKVMDERIRSHRWERDLEPLPALEKQLWISDCSRATSRRGGWAALQLRQCRRSVGCR